MTKEKISCVDCDNCYRAPYDFLTTCEAFRYPGGVPYQGKTFAMEAREAWKLCKGRKFKPRRPWWKRLLGLA